MTIMNFKNMIISWFYLILLYQKCASVKQICTFCWDTVSSIYISTNFIQTSAITIQMSAVAVGTIGADSPPADEPRLQVKTENLTWVLNQSCLWMNGCLWHGSMFTVHGAERLMSWNDNEGTHWTYCLEC